MERVSNSVVKTVSGRVYILVGKLNMAAECGEFFMDKWFPLAVFYFGRNKLKVDENEANL